MAQVYPQTHVYTQCFFKEITAFAFLQSSQELSDECEAVTGARTVCTEYAVEVVILSQAKADLLADLAKLKPQICWQTLRD